MFRRRRLAILASLAAFAGLVVFPSLAGATASAPVAVWAFDEASGMQVVDSVGGLVGTMSNQVARIGDGVTGGALRFSGGSVQIPDNAVLDTPDITVSLWVRAASAPTDGAVIAQKGTLDCGPGSWALLVDGGHVKLVYHDAKYHVLNTVALGDYPAFPSLWDGQWHHVAVMVKADPDGFGRVDLWEQGWVLGKSDYGVQHTNLDSGELSIGKNGGPCAGTAFTGDVDDVRVFPTELWGAELAAMEPPVNRTLAVQSATGGTPVSTGSVTVKLLPVPAVPGDFKVFATSPGGVEQQRSHRLVDGSYLLPADGVFDLGFVATHAGTTQIRVRYEPWWGDPVEATTSVEVAKAASGLGILGPAGIIDATNPITLVARASTDSPMFQPGGTVAFDEMAGDAPTQVATCQLQDDIGSQFSACQVDLAARPAGDYHFRARYLGSGDVLASTSWTTDVSVLPAVIAGPVSINDGASTTDSPIVTVSTPATGAEKMAFTVNPNDNTLGVDVRDYADSAQAWITAPGPVYDNDGLKTIWVRYSNQANHVTSWVSDSIVLDRGIQKGTVAINGGAASTKSKNVTLSVPVANPDLVASVEFSNDGVTWDRRGVAAGTDWFSAQPWTLAGGGPQTVWVRWRDLNGHGSMSVKASILVDLTGPVLAPVTATIPAGAKPSATVPLTFRWSATDPSGPIRYDVWWGRDGASWSLVRAKTTSKSLTVAALPGHSYAVRVRAFDALGHWTEGSATTLVAAYQEGSSSVAVSGTWVTASSAAYWHGGDRYALRAGASVTFKATAKRIAWVAPVGPTRGSARVYVDGVYVQTISLHATSSGSSRVVFQTSWSKAGSHRITIKVAGTTGHPRVDVDAFIVLR